jgi:outer membrane protein assembly factor BamA
VTTKRRSPRERTIASIVARFVALAATALGSADALGDEPAPKGQTTAIEAVKSGFDVLEGGETLVLPGNDLPEDLVGKPIRKIDVKVVGTLWPRPPVLKTALKDQKLSGDLVRAAVAEVLASGGFANAAMEVEASGDGVALTLAVVPRRLVAGVKIEGGDLDKTATLRAAGLADEVELTEEGLDEIRLKVLGFYASRGYPDARVSVRTVEVDKPLHALVAMDIEAGKPRTIAQRIFVIEPDQDREVGDLKKTYSVASGDRLDENDLDEADRKLVERLRAEGFYRAEVSHAAKYTGTVAYLYVNVNAGPKLEPLFEGNRSFDADQLGEALDLKKAGLGDAADAVSRIRKFYVDYGFYDVEVTGLIEPVPHAARERLVIVVRENHRVHVDKRVFLCLPKEIDPNDVGSEIDSVLAEELPTDDALTAPSPPLVDGALGPTEFAGKSASPLEVTPASTLAQEGYGKALKHLRELYMSKGYLNAVIGPVQVVRARCSSRSPAGECRELPFAQKPVAQCRLDPTGLPLPEPPLPEEMTCIPSADKHVHCSPHVTLRIPMNLGPQTTLWDIAFEGNRTATDAELAKLADLALGSPLSSEALEAARTRVLERYQDRGYAYAEVKTTIEPSADKTRARVRFSIQERDPVVISDIVVKGATRTSESLIVERVTMKKGSLYSKKGIRLSEERIATLGPFASVSVALEDPEVPDKQKRLVVTVAEHPSQYLDPRVGFSTGDGIRFAFEYGHRNIGGLAIALTLRVQLSYLFDFMILDDAVAKNLGPLPASERLERRNSARLSFPEIGLGPLVSLAVEGIDVRDNQRDFGLTREAIGPTVNVRPFRELVTTLGASIELNDVQIFNAATVNDAILKNPSLARLLRFPDGRTFAVAQRLAVSWDRRDTPFAATTGTLVTADVEHVNAYPASDDPKTAPIVSHFLRMRARVAGYLRFTKKGLALALSVGAGYNVQLKKDSKTYPDRLLYQGGFDTLRAFLTDSLVPEDVAQQILNPPSGTAKLTIDQVAIRGGDVSINPRAELRIPLTDTFQLGVFLDTGNLWVDPANFNPLHLRYALGSGIRVNTPIGPLAFDYGVNLVRRPWEDFGALHFSIGLL